MSEEDLKVIRQYLRERWGNMRQFGFSKKDWEDIKALSRRANLSPAERVAIASLIKAKEGGDPKLIDFLVWSIVGGFGLVLLYSWVW